MERHEPPWKHYIPISKNLRRHKDEVSRGSRSFRETSHPDEDPLLMIRCT